MRVLAVALLAGMTLSLTGCDEWRQPLRPRGDHWEKAAAARTALPGPAYRLRWDAHTVPRELRANEEVIVRVSFTNLGSEVWPDALAGDPEKRDGGYAVRLAFQWLDPGDPSRRPARRLDLPRPVRPGETLSLLVDVKAPPEPGDHQLSFELLQELVAWFDEHGAPKLVVPVSVKK